MTQMEINPTKAAAQYICQSDISTGRKMRITDTGRIEMLTVTSDGYIVLVTACEHTISKQTQHVR